MQISPWELDASGFQCKRIDCQVPDRDLGSHDPFRVGGSSPEVKVQEPDVPLTEHQKMIKDASASLKYV
jgi:hypothetical protein